MVDAGSRIAAANVRAATKEAVAEREVTLG
jgi:hypothetical protein